MKKKIIEISKILGWILFLYTPLIFGLLAYFNWSVGSIVSYSRLFLLSILLGILTEWSYDLKKKKRIVISPNKSYGS